MEASSKKPVTGFREVIQAPKKVDLFVTCVECNVLFIFSNFIYVTAFHQIHLVVSLTPRSLMRPCSLHRILKF